MANLGGLLRTAMHETAAEVAAPTVPPPPRPAVPRRGRARPGWLRLATPLAAAVAVIAVIAGALAIFRSVPQRTGAATGLAAAGTIPRYYVALAFTGNGACCQPGQLIAPQTRAVVKATATGAVLATIAAPRPYGTFTFVTAAADDRTFVLAAQRLRRLTLQNQLPATQFFLLHINPRGKTRDSVAKLIRLPISEPTDTLIDDMGLSPAGNALAVISDGRAGRALEVFSTATGARRTWNPGPAGTGFMLVGGSSSLSWEANGQTLGLVSSGVRLLDTGAPGGLLANSRLAVPPQRLPSFMWRQAIVTPDGRTVLAVIQTSENKNVWQQLDAFSASTGKLIRVLSRPRIQADYEGVAWSSPTGRVLIVSSARPGPGVPGAAFYISSMGVLTGGRYTPLPWSDRTLAAAW